MIIEEKSSTETTKTPLSVSKKKELIRLKRDLALIYRATNNEIAITDANRLETALFIGRNAVAAWLIQKYKIEV